MENLKTWEELQKAVKEAHVTFTYTKDFGYVRAIKWHILKRIDEFKSGDNVPPSFKRELTSDNKRLVFID